MKMEVPQMNNRREFLKKSLSLAAVPAILALSGKLFAQEKKKKSKDAAPAAAATGFVSPEEPSAKALGYIEKTKDPKKNCANCILYQACGKPKGPCQVLIGKGDVKAEGYCNSWNISTTCKS